MAVHGDPDERRLRLEAMGRFWSQPEFWPADKPGYRFLARAVLDKGKEKWGDDWRPAADLDQLKQALEIQGRRLEAGLERGSADWRGKLVEVDSRHWNEVDSSSGCFVKCKIDLSNPNIGYDGERYSWIFVAHTPATSAEPTILPALDIGSLSPYMRTLLTVSAKLAISPTNQPKKESLKADISAAWNSPFPLSERILDVMATILREPESQAGKNKASKG